MKMKKLPKYYTVLFNAVTDALEELRRNNCLAARMLLETGQCKAKELYISEADERPRLAVLPKSLVEAQYSQRS